MKRTCKCHSPNGRHLLHAFGGCKAAYEEDDQKRDKMIEDAVHVAADFIDSAEEDDAVYGGLTFGARLNDAETLRGNSRRGRSLAHLLQLQDRLLMSGTVKQRNIIFALTMGLCLWGQALHAQVDQHYQGIKAPRTHGFFAAGSGSVTDSSDAVGFVAAYAGSLSIQGRTLFNHPQR